MVPALTTQVAAVNKVHSKTHCDAGRALCTKHEVHATMYDCLTWWRAKLQ